MKNKKGVSLIEVLIVMAILGLLSMAAIMILNPQILIGKASDSRRKSDLNKIKIAFEEYFTDKGIYPSQININSWNISNNCEKKIDEISKYLNSWLCDPKGQPYTIISNNNWFKIVTNLENKEDKDIPSGWYGENTIYTTDFKRNEVNYGVSSSNVLWYEGICEEKETGVCLKLNSNGCNDAVGIGCSLPDACYRGRCTGACWVPSCH
jgi:prepilin-type N-terminal cleavage/methylation domain-containing protein